MWASDNEQGGGEQRQSQHERMRAAASWETQDALGRRASLVAQMVKASARNAGDPGSIPGLGRSPGEGIGYPLRYSWTSLVAQLVKNPPRRPGFDSWVGKIP